MKRCYRCDTTKDLSMFHKNRTSKDGLQPECKDCCKDLKKSSVAKRKAENESIGDTRSSDRIKRCYSCSIEKPETDYYLNPLIKGGVSNLCKECAKSSCMKYQSANRRKVTKQIMDYRRSMPPEKAQALKSYTKEYSKGYRAKNAEKIKQRRQEYAALKSYSQRWQEKKDRLIADGKMEEYRAHISVYQANRRIIRKMSESRGGITKQQWSNIKEKCDNRCLRCQLTVKLSLDHVIPVSKGGSSSAGNSQPLCKSCNSRKLTSMIDYRPWTMDSDEIGLDLFDYQYKGAIA